MPKSRAKVPAPNPPQQSHESLSPRSPLAGWEPYSLSPSTGEAVAMAEAFLSQDERPASSSAILPPEGQASFGVAAAMPREKFLPIKGADYTESFTTQLQSELRAMGEASFKKLPIWAHSIDVPTRQRIVFRKEFINRRNTINMTNDKHRRALQIYRIGAAQRVPCASCERGLGPFRKCVIDDNGSALRGSCTNCVFKEQGHKCQYHEKNRRQTLERGLETREGPDISTATGVNRYPATPKRPREIEPETEDSSQQHRQHSTHPEGRTPKRRKETGSATTKTPKPTPKAKRRKVPDAPPEVTSLISSDVVFQTSSFTAGQASAEQVQYILKRCDADQKAFFTGAWLSWCSERMALDKPQLFDGIEAFLAAGWYDDLNEVIPKVCPLQTRRG